MLLNKKAIPFILLLAVSACTGHDDVLKSFKFSKLIFHCGHIYGPGMAYDIELDSDRTILVKREMWKMKDETDSSVSGVFKGRIDRNTYDTILNKLLGSSYLQYKWNEVFCCDGSVRTLTVYANGKRTYRSSMYPPYTVDDLLAYLKKIALYSNLPRTNETFPTEPQDEPRDTEHHP